MAISKFLLDSEQQYRSELRIRNKWMVRVRWYYISLLPAIAIASTLLISSDKTPARQYAIVALTGLALNALLWLATTRRQGSTNYYRATAALQVMLDLSLASFVVYSQKGLMSRATLLYAIPILAAGMLFLKGFAYVAAVMSALAYGATLLIYMNLHPGSYALHDAMVPIVFYGSVFVVLAAIISLYSTVNAMDERQKSYTELMAMLRHQLYHPTGVIAALVEMLERGESYSKLSPKDQGYVSQIKAEGHRMNTMIANLIEAVQDADAAVVHADEPINIINLVDKTAVSCATRAKRPKDLSVNYPVESLMIAGQPAQLTIALENIIDNAFRFSESGTPVKVNIKHSDATIAIIVSDQGQGMSDKQQKQLFQRFTRFDEGTEDQAAQLYSMGLGLYVSKVIVERHNGSLEVESAPDKGTKITISL